MIEENKSSSKLTIVAFLSIVALAFLVVFTNSKFQEAVGIASDSGRVAFFLGEGSFSYTLEGAELAPGDTHTFKFSVSNQNNTHVSEVATQYSISVDNGDDLGTLPLKYTLFEANNGNKGSEVDFPYTSTVIPPGSVEHVKQDYLLEIHWPDDQNELKFNNQLKVVRLTFKVEQID